MAGMTELYKINIFAMTLLTGDTLKWATAVTESSETITTYKQFVTMFKSRSASDCSPSDKGSIEPPSLLSNSALWQPKVGGMNPLLRRLSDKR